MPKIKITDTRSPAQIKLANMIYGKKRVDLMRRLGAKLLKKACKEAWERIQKDEPTLLDTEA